MGFVQEFKEFAVKGNAMDMAVGIIIGAAFNKIVQSIVNDLIMPPIGMLLGKVDFKQLAAVLQHAKVATLGPDGKTVIEPAVPEVAIRYGQFINVIIEFVIVAFSVFVMVKFMNRLIRIRETKAPAA
ncbi:MAG: large-conductance mechanosensitive channel protein MscL [Phycisphaerales bacterium]